MKRQLQQHRKVSRYPRGMSEERPRKKPGRPPGKYKQFPHQHAVRFTAEGWRKLEALAAKGECDLAEVVRRAVDRMASEEGVE